jgi:hypothetical protein
MVPKVVWYRRVVKFSDLKEREKEVFKSPIEILKFAEDKEINRITIKDFMRSFYVLLIISSDERISMEVLAES